MLESKESYRFAGGAITFSCWYRTGAGYSGTGFTPTIIYGTGIDQNGVASGFTNQVTLSGPTYPNSNAWQRATFTTFIGQTASQVGLYALYVPVGTAGGFDYFDVTGVQLEKGSVATPFEVRPYGIELSLCQRYYEQSYEIGTAPGTNTVIGCPFFSGSTDFNKFMWATVRYAVPKRSNVAPTVYLSSGTSGQWTYETSAGVVNAAPTFYSNATTSFSLYLTAGTVAYTVARCFGHWVTNAEL
jgi:hypothetical protein